MTDHVWWKHGIIYQIYPRSFQDSNGDGVGDLEGIRRRLDHLQWLGVDAIWISPIFLSPMADFGYDVADYCAIDPLFGTIEDFDRLVADTHARGMKLILDFVPNHTSDRHRWFEDSRSSRQSPKRDWYIWRDGRPDGSPPNNWISNFGGSAWQWDEATGQFYYHAFLREQPDLNWRNPAVRAAMLDVLRFWMDRGVDGFRVDVIWHLIKEESFTNNPPNPAYDERQAEIGRYLQVYSADQPEVHGVIAEMRAVLDEYDDRVLIGEIYLPIERLVAYYGEDLRGAHLPFNFQLLNAAWDARHIHGLIRDYEAALPEGGWPNWVLGNHDKPRIAARVGAGQARIAAMLLLTLRGTPTLYYGDEIGIEKVDIPTEAAQDPWERNEPGLGLGRDPERTPMQWDGGPHAGFSTVTPWLPLEPAFPTRNVAALSRQPASILTLYRRLIELRRGSAALTGGSYSEVTAHRDVLAYERQADGDILFMALNLGRDPHAIAVPAGRIAGTIVLSTGLDRDGETVGGEIALAAHEGVIVRFGSR